MENRQTVAEQNILLSMLVRVHDLHFYREADDKKPTSRPHIISTLKACDTFSSIVAVV